MKKILFCICTLTALLSFGSCAGSADSSEAKQGQASDDTSHTEITSQADPDTSKEISSDDDTESQTTPTVTEGERDMLTIEINAGGKTFSGVLYDNDTARALIEKLPMTLDMSELNGNEKYYYLDSSLPTDPHKPDRIDAGDLMLYGDSCLVLFYESFSTSYSYTPIGHIDYPDGLASALGSGSVKVTFS